MTHDIARSYPQNSCAKRVELDTFCCNKDGHSCEDGRLCDKGKTDYGNYCNDHHRTTIEGKIRGHITNCGFKGVLSLEGGTFFQSDVKEKNVKINFLSLIKLFIFANFYIFNFLRQLKYL